jgi:hypothetical protein
VWVRRRGRRRRRRRRRRRKSKLVMKFNIDLRGESQNWS